MNPHPPIPRRSTARKACLPGVPAAVLLVLGLASPLWALIPGIAPGLVAILPQLLILAVAMLGLVLSPRSWWRFLRYTARHPLRVLVACAVPLLAAFLLLQLVAALAPPPRVPGPVPEVPGGFPPGDRLASGAFVASPGPLSRPEATRIDLEDTAAIDAPGEWIEAGGKAIRIGPDRRSLVAIDPALGRVAWKAMLDEPLACRPLPFERRVGQGTDAGIVAITLAPARPPNGGARMVVIDARDGSRRGAQDLPGRPEAAAIVDERLLVVRENALACLRLDPEGRAVFLWNQDRSPGRAVSLAGDECGRYYLLDENGLAPSGGEKGGELSSGGLEGGPPIRLAAYRGEAPRALAVQRGLAYVLVEVAGEFRLDCVDPVPRAGSAVSSRPGARGQVLWSKSVPAPLGSRIAIGAEGIVLTTQDGIVLIDAFTGTMLRQTILGPEPLSPAAVADGSSFALLSDGSAVRVAPESGREAWRLPEAVGDPSRAPHTATLIACGRYLVVEAMGSARVLASPVAGGRSWTHWRGGPSRRGAVVDSEAPLTGRELGRQPLGETKTIGSSPGSLLPVPGGCLVLRPGLTRSELWASSWNEEAGPPEAISGDIRGAVHHEERLFIAVEEAGAGRILCRKLGAATEKPRAVWSSAVPALSRSPVLAAGEEIVVACSGDGLRALSARSGATLWHRPESRGGTAPVVDGDFVFIASRDPDGSGGELAALGARDGSTRWTRPGRGARWGPPALHEETLLVVLDSMGDRRLLAIAARDGSTLRDTPVPGALVETPVAASHTEIIVGLESGEALVISPGGEVRGRTSIPGAPGPPHLAVAVGALVLGGSSSLGCFDTASLESLWKLELAAPIEDVVLHEGRILALAGGALVTVGAE